MKRIAYTTGLLTVLMLMFGSAITIAQARFDLRFRIGNDRVIDPYYAELGTTYNVPYDAMYEMRAAGIADEDMPVILYIMANSPYSLRQIYSLRARGATWENLSNWCGVPLYYDNPGYYRHNGPPYGNAYGYYKKHPGRYYDGYPNDGYNGNHYRKYKGHHDDDDD